MHRLQKVFTLTKLIPKVRLTCGVPPAFPLAHSKSNSHLSFPLHSISQRQYTTSDSDADSNNGKRYPKINTLSAPQAQHQINKNPIFVSKFFEITNEEIFRFLDSVKLEYRMRPSGQIVTKCCPFCDKPHHNKPDNLWSLNMKPDSGAFLCFRCGTRGSWFDFKNMLVGNGKHFGTEIEGPNNLDFGARRPSASSSANEPKLASESVAYLRVMSLLSNDFPEINQYLTGYGAEDRHLSLETLEKYKVGAGYESFLDANGEYTEVPCVYFPMFACKKDKSIKRPKSKEPETQEETPSQVDLKEAGLDSSNLSIIDAINQETGTAKTDKQTIDVNKQAKSEKPVIEINDANNILVRTKIRAVYKKNKGYQRMEPAPGYWGLFGLNTVPAKAKAVVLTEGEYDAMAVYEATKLPAISLPNGANHLPLQVLPWLEKFERIYLWMDADAVGQTNAVNFAQKLGVGRVYIVNTKRFDPEGPKDANDALRKDPSSLIKYINEARPLTRDNITTFSEMRFQILNRILRFEENTGLKSQYFRWFNSKIKGFRKGEMTILTGGTGSGKTTLLSQLSLDFAQQGIGTLWGSFEVKNDILMTNMLMQYSGINMYKEPHKFDYHSQSFEKIPLYFLKYFGSNEMDKILHSIEYAIYAFDIGHVIVDNLQFLLSGQGRGFERFDIQDDAISKLRDLATSKNVHVTLVIHPKKVDDNQDLTISSVFGSAKATQEADNIILIQNRPKYKVVEIRKNRFDGDLGKIPLGFDKDTKRFFELKESEVFNLHRTPETMKELVEKRKSQINPEQLSETIHENDENSAQDSNEALKKKMESIFEENAGVTNRTDLGKENGAQKKATSRASELQFGESLEAEAAKYGNQQDIEEKYEENVHDPEVSLENYGPVVDEEIAREILESSLNQDQGEVKSSDSETDAAAKQEVMKASEPEETPQVEEQTPVKQGEMDQEEKKEEVVVQAQENVAEKVPEQENKVEKPKKKEGKKSGLYGKLYVEQEKQVTPKNSFYSEDDREAVRENMEYLENERLKKAAQFRKKRFRPEENPGYDVYRPNDNGNRKK